MGKRALDPHLDAARIIEVGVAELDVGEGVAPRQVQRAVRGRYHVLLVYERSGAAVLLGCYSELS